MPEDVLLVEGATLVIAGHDTTDVSIAFRAAEFGLEIREIGRTVISDAPDTIPGAGVYVHSANTFQQDAPVKAGAQPMLVLREGKSPGGAAVLLINARGGAATRPILPEENHPVGRMSRHVGCYDVELGEWDDSAAARRFNAVPVPPSVQLHWQYKWHLGREQLLVATDGEGRVPARGINLFSWRSIDRDLVVIDFSTGYTMATFRLRTEESNLVGYVGLFGHSPSGPVARAPVRLRRRPCPA